MALRINHLSKTYGNGVVALNDISLTIAPGMFGLLGPNDAGKSTLVRTIATLPAPDSGSIHFRDVDVLAQPSDGATAVTLDENVFRLYVAMHNPCAWTCAKAHATSRSTLASSRGDNGPRSVTRYTSDSPSTKPIP